MMLKTIGFTGILAFGFHALKGAGHNNV